MTCAATGCTQPATRRWRTHCQTFEMCDHHARSALSWAAYGATHNLVYGVCETCRTMLTASDFADLGPLGVRPA